MLSLGEVLILGLCVYALIDAAMSDRDAARYLPKWAWVVLILFVPFLGAIGWFLFGRPHRSAPAPRAAFGPPRAAPRRPRPARADDEADIRAHIAERDRLLAQWADEDRRKQDET